MKKLFLLVAFAALNMTAAMAQKVGYLNAALVVADLPETKAADSDISALAAQLQKKDSMMVIAFQTKYQELAKKQQEGTLSPKQIEDESKKLEDQKNEITKFEQEMNKQIGEKRQALLQPLYEKLNKAIEEVSKEGGYSFVVDATSGVLLYADEKNDLTNTVRAKLGLPALPADKK